MILKPELTRRVWEKVNVGRQGYKERLRYDDVELIINEFLKTLSQCMIDGEDVHMRGFGKFVSNIRKGRVGFDGIRKKKIRFPDRRVIKFNISKNIDTYVRGEKEFEILD